MGKECKLYYSVVVDSGGYGWAPQGSKSVEPIKVEEQEPLGREPEFCCKDFEEAFHGDCIHSNRVNAEFALVISHSFDHRPFEEKTIKYCPFCSAKIILIEDLHLKVIQTPIERHIYYLEITSK